MKYIYGRHDFANPERGEENCYLMTNGLGGFSSLTMLGSCSRNDHALLMACRATQAPNNRLNLLHRMQEKLTIGEQEYYISTQKYGNPSKREEGYLYLSSFIFEDYPTWLYEVDGVYVEKRVVMLPGYNTVGIAYELQNRTEQTVTITATAKMEFVPKGQTLEPDRIFEWDADKGRISSAGIELYVRSNGTMESFPTEFETDYLYERDACDGRKSEGCVASNHRICLTVAPGASDTLEIIYSMENKKESVSQMADLLVAYRTELLQKAGLTGENAKRLVLAANQFISYRASTGKKTILAGFPFFEDWGRDTMISLPGCCLVTGQLEMAKDILRTFMAYTKDGLMPNLFPEGGREPMYNTVDAALLFVITVYDYYCRTGDLNFVHEAWPVMEDIVDYYMQGTRYGIGMDTDCLLYAGEKLDQVTWMDVRIGDILPTPRHGKPVEINAYWYNVLMIMDAFEGLLKDNELLQRNPDMDTLLSGGRLRISKSYRRLAQNCRDSFREKFYCESTGCLKDFVAAEPNSAGENQIRCNQIWVVSLPFPILERQMEKQIVETVYRKLYTPLGLRTLDREDAQYHGFYGGELMERDLAYHQGTVWTYPLGAYYMAYLKVNNYSEEARRTVYRQLESIEASLREGCIGQLPEIYDGDRPVFSKGCFAQAWSVGELLRVYEALEKR